MLGATEVPFCNNQLLYHHGRGHRTKKTWELQNTLFDLVVLMLAQAWKGKIFTAS